MAPESIANCKWTKSGIRTLLALACLGLGLGACRNKSASDKAATTSIPASKPAPESAATAVSPAAPSAAAPGGSPLPPLAPAVENQRADKQTASAPHPITQVAAVLLWLKDYARSANRGNFGGFGKYFSPADYVLTRVSPQSIETIRWAYASAEKEALSTLRYEWPQVRISAGSQETLPSTVVVEFCQKANRARPGKPSPTDYSQVTLTLRPDPEMTYVVVKEHEVDHPVWHNCSKAARSDWRLEAAATALRFRPETCAPEDAPECEYLGGFLEVSSASATQVVYLDLNSTGTPEFNTAEGELLIDFGHGSSQGQLRFRREGAFLQLETRWFDNDQPPTGEFEAGPRIDLGTTEPLPLWCPREGEDRRPCHYGHRQL